MKGTFVYLNEGSSVVLFGKEFWLRYEKKKLKYIFKGETNILTVNFMSTIGIKEKKIQIQINWTKEDLILEN